MSSEALEQSLVQYRELCAKIENKFSEIRAKYESSFTCKLGCHSCCKPDLTVNNLEKESIQRWLTAHPENLAGIKKLAEEKPHGKKRCALLDAAGACSIYEVRPLVCRSHGAPLQFRDPASRDPEAVRFRDVCPLNFKDQDLAKIPAEQVLNLDTINTLLALLEQRAFGKKSERNPLLVDSFKL